MSKVRVGIRQRRASRSDILENDARLRDVMLGNLWNRRGRKGIVWLVIVTVDRRRLVMERNCLETTERDIKVPWSSLSRNLI
ncbi:hypothetical protein A2U01_0008550, partial [Trifolium medium]|nr:hypothetical protein [Trifolium medium]